MPWFPDFVNAAELARRQTRTAGQADPVGLYFGTRGGQLYGSNDEGESWRAIAEFLPPILCVKTATVN